MKALKTFPGCMVEAYYDERDHCAVRKVRLRLFRMGEVDLRDVVTKEQLDLARTLFEPAPFPLVERALEVDALLRAPASFLGVGEMPDGCEPLHAEVSQNGKS